MTPAEIQQTIEGMLAVQRSLQDSQLALKEGQLDIRERQLRLLEVQEENNQQIKAIINTQQRTEEHIGGIGAYMRELISKDVNHERRIEQLIGYSISTESDHLTLLERLIALEQKVKQLEQN